MKVKEAKVIRFKWRLKWSTLWDVNRDDIDRVCDLLRKEGIEYSTELDRFGNTVIECVASFREMCGLQETLGINLEEMTCYYTMNGK